MKAVVLRGHGGLEQLSFETVADPEPGEGEVVVEVTAAALNNTDIWTREGAYGLPGDPDALAGWRGEVEFPRIQGGDIAGRVRAVGAGVDIEVGARVLVDPAIYDSEGPDANPVGLLGSEADGGFAELVAVDARRVHDTSASPLDDRELACLPIAFGTAAGMLERGSLASGETVLVTGASGGVGLAAVSLAAARGARVVAVTSGSKAELVGEAGADVVVDRNAGDIAQQIAGRVDGTIDLVADVVAGESLPELLGLLAEGGRWVIAGALAGAVVELDVRRLYLHNRRLIGSSMHTPAHFDRLAEDAREGRVRPRVAEVFSLEQLADAQRELLRREHVGKIVVVPGGATGS